MDIRNATLSDALIISAYNSRMAEETENRTLDRDVIGPGVEAVLGDSSKGRYWVATVDDKIVGQIMATYEWGDWRNGTLWWIQSVYVDPGFRRQRIFSALYHHVESLAGAAKDVCGLRLYVENDNKNAQRTYEALGMTNSGYRVMESIPGKNAEHDGDESC